MQPCHAFSLPPSCQTAPNRSPALLCSPSNPQVLAEPYANQGLWERYEVEWRGERTALPALCRPCEQCPACAAFCPPCSGMPGLRRVEWRRPAIFARRLPPLLSLASHGNSALRPRQESRATNTHKLLACTALHRPRGLRFRGGGHCAPARRGEHIISLALGAVQAGRRCRGVCEKRGILQEGIRGVKGLHPGLTAFFSLLLGLPCTRLLPTGYNCWERKPLVPMAMPQPGSPQGL